MHGLIEIGSFVFMMIVFCVLALIHVLSEVNRDVLTEKGK